MVLANFKSKVIFFAGNVIYQVCSTLLISPPFFPAVASSAMKAAQDVLPASVYRVYDFLELCHPKFQFAKGAGYCLVEEFRKILVQTEYKTHLKFASANEAQAATISDLLKAGFTPLPGLPCRPQVSDKVSPCK